ncbi:MAG TPA: hypothetical protein VNL95_06905 [Dehalococcoidia bacterium]|nr:hypothetical protein [Dehalococcoidia bacterium]
MVKARPAPRRRPPSPRPARPSRRPWLRVVALAVAAFALAVALHSALGAAGVSPYHPVRLFLTPLLAATVVAVGVGPLPTGRRLRLALLVAAGLFLYSLVGAS